MRGVRMQQLRQRVIASYHLGPMDAAETRGYIEHRLTGVGWKDAPHFEPGAFAAIHSASAGIPRRINLLCNRLLLGGYLGGKHVVTAEEVEAIVAEVEEEIGTETALAGVAGTATAPGPKSHSTNEIVHRGDVVALEERMRRVEKLLESIVDLLPQLTIRDVGPRR